MCFIVHIFRNYFSDICWGGNRSVWKSCRKYILTKSSKSPASIAKSNKQWVGTCLYQEACKRLLINCGAVIWL